MGATVLGIFALLSLIGLPMIQSDTGSISMSTIISTLISSNPEITIGTSIYGGSWLLYLQLIAIFYIAGLVLGTVAAGSDSKVLFIVSGASFIIDLIVLLYAMSFVYCSVNTLVRIIGTCSPVYSFTYYFFILPATGAILMATAFKKK